MNPGATARGVPSSWPGRLIGESLSNKEAKII